jgi:hypothetical protein
LAEQLKIVRHYVTTDVEDSLDLRFAGGSGVFVADAGWIPKFGENDIVTEILNLTVQGTTRNNLATRLQSIETRLEQIRQFIEATPEKYYVVLRDQIADETNARQAWLAGFSAQLEQTFHTPELIVKNYRLGLDRTPWWESVDDFDIVLTNGAIACHGGYDVLTLPATVGIQGSMPARIAQTTIERSLGGVSVTEIWAGFRTARFGTLANFTCPWWASFAGSYGYDTTTMMGIWGSDVACTFASHPEMVMRFKVRAHDITASNYDDLRGTFDVIALMRVDSGTTASVRLDNLLGTTVVAYGTPVLADSTTWKYYNLGRITWPPAGRITSMISPTPLWAEAALQMSAQRISGSGSAYFKIMVPVPVNEGFFHVSGMNVYYTSPSNYQAARLTMDPLGSVMGTQLKRLTSPSILGAYTPLDTRGTAPSTFHLPVSTATRIVVAAQTASPDSADTVNLAFYAHERFRTLRGTA